MTAPSFLSASTGTTDAGGAWTHAGQSLAAGTVVILHVLQDGSGSGQVSLTSVTATTREDLAGTDGVMTLIPGSLPDGSSVVGGAAEARQWLWIGRSLATGATTYTGANSGTDDLYIREYAFSNVITVALGGTSLETVIENDAAVEPNPMSESFATSTTCSDAIVTTLGVDRLACNFGALADDAMGIAVFTGMTGGTWGNFQSYETATGTDGTIFAEFANMAAAGTIDGGSDTITSIAWGVVGFALIGTTVVAVERVPRFTPYPQLLAH